ncbi:MAG: FimB/Mfa2 family fimbrial subunit, partial [Odoribacteraceae bacterium]|nr:FimB/Mfa2 family fimbrial subunit [Odoribacteraceae bacterium]
MFGACVQDLNEGEKQETSIDGDDSALVTLSLSMPPVTRAMTDAQENHVDNVDVLLFSTTDDKLYYRAIGASITNPAGNSREFNARLPLGTYNVVVLANARDLFTGAIAPSSLFGGPPPAAATGDTRANVLGGLTFSSITSGKIPMWGYYNGLTIDDLTPSPAATVDLTRAIARVDVSLDAAVNNFELTSVHLYHYSDKGNIAPVASGIGTYLSSQWDATNKKATGPNLAASAKVNNFVSYTVPASQS